MISQENVQRIALEEKRRKREEQRKAAKGTKAARGMAAPPPESNDGCIVDNLLKEIREGTSLRPTKRPSIRRSHKLSSSDLKKLHDVATRSESKSKLKTMAEEAGNSDNSNKVADSSSNAVSTAKDAPTSSTTVFEQVPTQPSSKSPEPAVQPLEEEQAELNRNTQPEPQTPSSEQTDITVQQPQEQSLPPETSQEGNPPVGDEEPSHSPVQLQQPKSNDEESLPPPPMQEPEPAPNQLPLSPPPPQELHQPPPEGQGTEDKNPATVLEPLPPVSNNTPPVQVTPRESYPEITTTQMDEPHPPTEEKQSLVNPREESTFTTLGTDETDDTKELSSLALLVPSLLPMERNSPMRSSAPTLPPSSPITSPDLLAAGYSDTEQEILSDIRHALNHNRVWNGLRIAMATAMSVTPDLGENAQQMMQHGKKKKRKHHFSMKHKSRKRAKSVSAHK